MLWKKDESTPPLASTQVECTVVDARGQLVTEDGSARLELPGAEIFKPDSLSVCLFRGRYFR